LLFVAAAAIGTIGFIPDDRFISTVGLPLATLSAGIVVAAAAQTQRQPWKLLVALGTVSYGLYVWHNPIIHSGLVTGWAFSPLVTIPTSLLVAVLSYRYVEQPFLRLKQRSPHDRHISDSERGAVPAVS
jgi:peptidoglycan/LPS O-acetylase OafA/YrhL